MKDVYELLNDVDIDTNEYEGLEVDISEVTKKRLKNKVCNEIKTQRSLKYKKSKSKSIWKVGSVAVLLIAIIGVTSPTIAKTISDTIKYFEESRIYNAKFERYSKGVNLTSTDNKISIKLNSVVYDGASLYLAYEVNTETPLKYGFKIWSTDLMINDKKISGNEKRKVKDHDFNIDIYENYDYKVKNNDNIERYAVTTRWDLTECKLDDTKSDDINIQWNINNIHGIDGKWSFKFKASKKELMDKSKIFRNVGEVSFDTFQKYKIDKFIVNPLETRMELTQIINKVEKEEYKKNNSSEEVLGGFNLTYDNLIITNNDEELFGLGGSGYGVDAKDNEEVNKLSYSFYGLNTVPTELKIIPVKSIENSTHFKYIKIKDLKAKMELKQGKDTSIVINYIEKKENDLKMNISFKGIDIDRRSSLFIVDDIDEYFRLKDSKELDKIELKGPVDFNKELKNYNVNRNVNLLFKDLSEEGYLMYMDYDSRYKLDVENAKIIKLD